MNRTKFKIATLFLLLTGAGAGIHAAAQKQQVKHLAGYNAIVVENFTVDKNPATEEFPKGLETMMQNRAVVKLREQKVFEQVVDASETANTDASKPAVLGDAAKTGESPEPAKPAAQASGVVPGESARRLVLSGTVLIFDKGSRAARNWVGFGAGQAKMKVHFALRDPQTGAIVLQFDHQGAFKGIISSFGGSQEEAFAKAASSVVNGLLKEIAKQR